MVQAQYGSVGWVSVEVFWVSVPDPGFLLIQKEKNHSCVSVIASNVALVCAASVKSPGTLVAPVTGVASGGGRPETSLQCIYGHVGFLEQIAEFVHSPSLLCTHSFPSMKCPALHEAQLMALPVPV